jgi:hypothetical protein
MALEYSKLPFKPDWHGNEHHILLILNTLHKPLVVNPQVRLFIILFDKIAAVHKGGRSQFGLPGQVKQLLIRKKKKEEKIKIKLPFCKGKQDYCPQMVNSLPLVQKGPHHMTIGQLWLHHNLCCL